MFQNETCPQVCIVRGLTNFSFQRDVARLRPCTDHDNPNQHDYYESAGHRLPIGEIVSRLGFHGRRARCKEDAKLVCKSGQ